MATPAENHECVTSAMNQDTNNESNTNSNEPPMTLDIVINNVVCSFNVRCHLDLRRIALNGANVEYKRENGMVTMKIRKPYATASVWSSGKITCTGATSEDIAKIAARRFARVLQKLGFKTHFSNYRVVNVLGTCTMPFAIRIIDFSRNNKQTACYEPELHPGVTYKLKDPKATMKIFSTGSITITAPSVQNVQAAVEHIFPLVYEFRKEKVVDIKKMSRNCKNNHKPQVKSYKRRRVEEEQEEDDDEDNFDDSFDSMDDSSQSYDD